MSICRIRICCVTCLTLLALGQIATAQSRGSFWGAKYNQDGSSSGVMPEWMPWPDDSMFDAEFQWFAPAESGEYGEPDKLNYGFFASYDMAYWYTSRPDKGQFQFQQLPGTEFYHGPMLGNDAGGFDRSWGRRIEIGWMPESNSGWTIANTSGSFANAGRTFKVPELDFDPEDSEHDLADEDFDPNFDQIILGQVYNRGRYNNTEINKVWRLKALRKGGVLEPYAGLRYLQYTDFGESSAVDTDCDFASQIVRRLYTGFNNRALAAQIGTRWTMVRGRWEIRGDLRAFLGQNYQRIGRFFSNETVIYDPVPLPACGMASEVARFHETTDQNFTETEFLWGQEGRIEFAFTLYRDVALRVGGNILHIPGGIGRGPNYLHLRESEQDLIIGGVTFGVEVNR